MNNDDEFYEFLKWLFEDGGGVVLALMLTLLICSLLG